MENTKIYSQLKTDIIALKEYVAGLHCTRFSIDGLLSEMNDLLLGIENGQLVFPYKNLKLASTHHAVDGAFGDDTRLKNMIFQIQDDIYSIRKYIAVQQKPWFYFKKKYENINWLFPNLNCKNGHIQCIAYQDEDMLDITFYNGYGIDLGFCDGVFIITVTKDNDWTNIIEEERISSRCMVEKKLQKLIYKYENL